MPLLQASTTTSGDAEWTTSITSGTGNTIPSQGVYTTVIGPNNTLEMNRSSRAYGYNLTIGYGNTVGGTTAGQSAQSNASFSVVVGYDNILRGSQSFILGDSNELRTAGSTRPLNTFCLGQNNTVHGTGRAFVFGTSHTLGAAGNTAGNRSLVFGDYNEIASGGAGYHNLIGGYYNRTTGGTGGFSLLHGAYNRSSSYFGVALGRGAHADKASLVFASNAVGYAADQGQSQLELIRMDRRTTAGGSVNMQQVRTGQTPAGAVDGIPIPDNGALAIRGVVTAWNETAGNESATWFIDALVRADGAGPGVTIVGQQGNGDAATVTAASRGFNDIVGDAGTIAVALVEDDTNQRVNIQVTGATDTYRWSAAFLVARATT